MSRCLLFVSVVAFTHQGKVRKQNEDTIAIAQWIRNRPMLRPEVSQHSLEHPFVGMVADGMGGHAAGEVASQFVIDRLTDAAPAFVSEERISAQIRDANKALFDLMASQSSTTGMGTTVAGLAITSENVFIFNVGDSRVYREQYGYLKQLTVDDSGGGRTSYGEESEVKTGLLSQALGGASQFIEIRPHVREEELLDNQRYLVCSDGLSDMVDIDTLEECLADSDVESIKNLFGKALEGGGRDNISILIIRTHLRDKKDIALAD